MVLGMTLEEFEYELAAIIGRLTVLRPFVCDGSPIDCQIMLVGFNPRTPLAADYWSFWKRGHGFDKDAFERAYHANRLIEADKVVSPTRQIIRRVEIGAGKHRVVEANLYAQASDNERGLLKEDRDLTAFSFLLKAIRPRVVVPFGRHAAREVSRLNVECHVRPVRHFSRGWSYDAAEAFGRELAAL
jgi:hypothetical protein